MGNRIVKLKKGELLFKEGDPSEAMYIIKSGKLAITKNKGNSNITLAELKQGDMLGEMGFFESAPRSAGALAITPVLEVIELPFSTLHKQYEALPMWVKAIMKAINSHLIKANTKIRQLEKTNEEEKEMFTDHLITQLCSILGFVASHYGEPIEGKDDQWQVPGGLLRTFTIQIFQLPTHKMQKLVEVLCDLGYMEVQNLGEGKQKMIMKDLDFIFSFIEFFNNNLFSETAKKFRITDVQLKSLKAICFYAPKADKDGKGNVTLNITEISNTSQQDMGQRLSINDCTLMAEMGLLGDHTQDSGNDFVSLDPEYIAEITEYWNLVYTLKAFQSD